MRISKANFFYIILLSLGFIITIAGPIVLPGKFYYDSTTILTNPYNLKGLKGSFEFTIWFYKITGLSKLPYFIIGIIQSAICFYLLYKIWPTNNFHKITTKNLLLFCLYIVLAIFMASPTKEFITFVYFSLIVIIVIKNKKRRLIKVIFLISLYAYFFRTYFILVLITSIILYFFMQTRIANKKILLLIYGLSIVIGLSLAFGVIKGEYISNSTREMINSSRTTDNNSAIQSPIKTDTWYGESVGIIYGFISVNYPINAFKKLSPQIIVFALFQIFLMFYFVKKLYIYVIPDNNEFNKWFFYFCISYFFVQALFEPDLGSAIRHKIGVLPLLYYMFNYELFKRKRRENI